MKYFMGFVAIVALVILVVVLVIRGFTGGGSKAPKPQSVLSDYTNTTTVMRFTLEGPVTADQNYREVRVTVGRDANSIEVLKGYQGQVLQVQTYPNNAEAYGNFLRALQLMGYTRGSSDTKLSDERGYCPGGNRYVYEIISGASSVQRYWIGTCGVGTFKGNSASVRALFRRQIPDYDRILSTINLSS